MIPEDDLQSNSATSVENEYKYELVKPHASRVIEYLSSVNRLGKFRFGSSQRLRHKDTYFDTEQQDIRRINGSLRTRIVDDAELLITLKLRTSWQAPHAGDQHSRLETEDSPAVVLRHVWQQLTDLQIIQKPFVELDLHRVGIEGVLYIWGFHKQFQAETRRTYRHVIAPDGSAVGTLFLDRVDYSYLHKRSRFFEIEIESTKESNTAVSKLVEQLKEQFSEAIIPSAVSKYERGLALVGLQDENKIETKLEIIGNSDDVVDKMHLSGNELMQRINLKLGWDGRLTISDTYYDTPGPDFNLFQNNCYLRLRSQEGAKPILTFREYHPERDRSVSEQIKEEATQESITKVINYLQNKGIDSVRVPPDPLPSEFHDYLIAAGLRISTKIRIDRRVFPVLDREERKIANIKLDQVSFSRHDTAVPYAEIEISSAHHDYLAQVAYIALTLLNEFEPQLRAISKPKYFTAQEQLLRNERSNASQPEFEGQPIRFRILQDVRLSDAKPEPESQEYSRARIRRVLVETFSEEELATLAWDLNIDHENLSSGGKSSKARELVALMARTGRLSVLVSHIQQLRPNANWDKDDE